jgi:hypothetical protein
MGETTETQNTHSISYYLDQSFQKIHVVETNYLLCTKSGSMFDAIYHV